MASKPAATDYDSAYRITLTPEPADIDEMGHVNNVVYLRWSQDIATQHWFSVVSPDQSSQWLWVALRHEIDYREQILPGDMVEIRTWLGRAKGARFERFVDIRKSGSLKWSANVRTDWCLIDALSRRPQRVSADILSLFGLVS